MNWTNMVQDRNAVTLDFHIETTVTKSALDPAERIGDDEKWSVSFYLLYLNLWRTVESNGRSALNCVNLDLDWFELDTVGFRTAGVRLTLLVHHSVYGFGRNSVKMPVPEDRITRCDLSIRNRRTSTPQKGFSFESCANSWQNEWERHQKCVTKSW